MLVRLERYVRAINRCNFLTSCLIRYPCPPWPQNDSADGGSDLRSAQVSAEPANDGGDDIPCPIRARILNSRTTTALSFPSMPKKAASADSTLNSARDNSPCPRGVNRGCLAGSLGDMRLVRRRLRSRPRNTCDIVFGSMPTCRATRAWLTTSPLRVSQPVPASTTNCGCVNSRGARHASIDRRHSRPVRQSRKPGLRSGPLNLLACSHFIATLRRRP